MSVPAKQIRDPESLQAEAEILVAGAEAPHYGSLALLAIALFAITVSPLDRMVATPHSAPPALLLSAR